MHVIKSTATQTPSFETCATKVMGPNGEMKVSKTVGPTTECKYQKEFYGGFQPRQLHNRLLAQFLIDTSTFPTKPSFIESYNFGVTDVTLETIVQCMNGKLNLNKNLLKINQNTNVSSDKDINGNELKLAQPERNSYSKIRGGKNFFFIQFNFPFQDYFSSYETGQSVGVAKTEEPREKTT